MFFIRFIILNFSFVGLNISFSQRQLFKHMKYEIRDMSSTLFKSFDSLVLAISWINFTLVKWISNHLRKLDFLFYFIFQNSKWIIMVSDDARFLYNVFQYKIWKGWAIWKHFVRRKKKKLYMASIEKLLFLSNPLLAKVLLQIQMVPTKFISKLFKLFKLQHHYNWHRNK